MFEEIAGIIGQHSALIVCDRLGGQAIYMSVGGVHHDALREILGKDKADALFKHFARTMIEIPRANDIHNIKRDAEIRELARNGATRNELAYNFGMTSRNVRRILSKGQPIGEQNHAANY